MVLSQSLSLIYVCFYVMYHEELLENYNVLCMSFVAKETTGESNFTNKQMIIIDDRKSNQYQRTSLAN